jgi:hypothetical protein
MRPLVEGWVLGAMCEHLTAVSGLLVNVLPGFMKSLLVDCSGRRGSGAAESAGDALSLLTLR